MKSLKPDLQVMAFVTLFVPQPVLEHPDPRHDPVSSLAAAGAPRRHRPSTGRSPRARRETGLSIFWPDEGLDDGADPAAEEDADRPRRDARRRLLQEALPAGRRRHDESRSIWCSAGKAPRIKQDHVEGDLRGLVARRTIAEIDWGKPGADRQPDPRLQPGARRLEHAQRQAARHLRRQALRQGPQGHRRQARRDRRHRRRRHDHRVRRTARFKAKRVAARRRQEDRRPANGPRRGSRPAPSSTSRSLASALSKPSLRCDSSPMPTRSGEALTWIDVSRQTAQKRTRMEGKHAWP